MRAEGPNWLLVSCILCILHNWKTFYFVQKQYFDRNNARQLEYRKVMMTHARLEKKHK